MAATAIGAGASPQPTHPAALMERTGSGGGCRGRSPTISALCSTVSPTSFAACVDILAETLQRPAFEEEVVAAAETDLAFARRTAVGRSAQSGGAIVPAGRLRRPSLWQRSLWRADSPGNPQSSGPAGMAPAICPGDPTGGGHCRRRGGERLCRQVCRQVEAVRYLPHRIRRRWRSATVGRVSSPSREGPVRGIPGWLRPDFWGPGPPSREWRSLRCCGT